MKFKRYQLLFSSLLLCVTAGFPAFAKTKSMPAKKNGKKKTVGELLNQAKREAKGAQTQLSKSSTSLPSANLGFKEATKSYNLDSVKPPPSSILMKKDESNRGKAEYERILDQQIRELYKLTQKFKGSPNRGELWLRLAELYVEKAGVIDAIKQDEYDAKLRSFQAGKTRVKPVLDLAEAREYNKKAVQLYEWFQRDFPRDEKMSQALFFLGYNHFEMGNATQGVEYYEKLTREYSSSPFVGEAHFALGEYHFENERWPQAYKEYAYLIKEKKHRLHTFALYKGAWCLFRLGKSQQALKYLEYIISTGRAESAEQQPGRRNVNRNRLEGEALRDIVTFYAEAGEAGKSVAYFRTLVGKDYASYLERLAYQYSDRGYKDASMEVFKTLITQFPTAAKSFEYQYQVVQNFYYAKDTSRFKAELYSWVIDYGKGSAWQEANKENKELMETSFKLRETTLRNYVLQQHQTAQNSRAPFSQGQANEGYQLYLKEFSESSFIGDMHFYYGELLYDMSKYDEAAMQYKWVLDNTPQSKFYNKSAQNLILSVERSIPTDQEMQKRVGTSTDPIPLEPKVERFIKAGQWYSEKFPKSDKAVEIKFRIGRLYYQSNQFDPAIQHFREIVQQHPTSKYAEYSANLLLDIYNLKKDYVGLAKVGTELLAVPSIAASKVGADIRGVVEKASFKRGQDLELEKKYGESAQVYQDFAKQNPKSSLALMATFNSGVNFERAGLNASAIAAYQTILSSSDSAAESMKPNVRRLLAKQYQDSAQFEEAAKLYRQSAEESPKDPLSSNWMFNAAVLYEALGKHGEAIKTYESFVRLSKKHSDNIEAVFSIAQNHRKVGQRSAAITRYTEYIDGGGRNQEKVVEAAYWVSQLYAQQGSVTKAKEWSQRTLAIQARFAPDRKGVGASFAAKIKFALAVETFKSMKAVTFPADPSRQKAAADRKVSLLTKLTGELVDVIKYDSAEEIVSALSVLGQANDDIGQAIINAPLPAGLTPDEAKQYKEGVEKFAEPFKTKARESFKAATDRGLELEVYNDEFKVAYSYMNRVDPKSYYDGGEIGSDIRLVNWIGQ